MIINKVWAMPNKYTFEIKPINELLTRYNVGVGWVDPFCGNSKLCNFRNDLNMDTKIDAYDYINSVIKGLTYIDGFLLDPPYSLEQISRSYKNIGKTHWQKETHNFNGSFPKVRDLISEILQPGKLCISFGWNSNGLGKNRGFEQIEILLVAHGGNHNDTICVVERKTA